MKKNLLNSILFKTSLVVLGLLFAGTIFAQTTILNGQTVLASDIPINTPVTINAGGTLDMDVARTFTNLGTANSGISTISGAAALTVSGQLTVPGTNTLSTSTSVTASTFFAANVGIATATLAGTGSFNIGFMNIYGSANGASTLSIATALTVQTGSINTGLGNPFTTFFLIVSGTLKISGAVDINLDGFTCNNGSTVEYNGAAQTVYATDYHHLILSGSGAKTLQAATNIIGGNLTLGGTATSATASDMSVTGSVTIGNGLLASTFTLENNDDLTVAGNTIVNNNSTLTTSGGNVLILGGNLANNGTFDANITGGNDMNVVFNGAANQTVSGTGTTTDFNNITINKNGAAGNDQVQIISSSFTVPAGFLTLTNGVFKVSGSFTLTNTFFDNNNYTIPAVAGFWLNNPNVIVTAQNDEINIDGFLRITAGTYNVGNSNDDYFRYGNNSTVTIEGGSLNLAASLRPDNGGNTITYSQSGGTVSIGAFTAGSGSTGIFDISAAGSTFNMSAGTIILQRMNSNFGGADYLVLATTNNVTGGTLQIGNTLTPAGQTININSSAPVFNLTVNGINNPTANMITNPLTVKGAISINASNTLNANSLALNVAGNFTNNGTFTPGTQTTTFNGSALQTIGGTTVTTFNGITFNNGTGFTLATNNTAISGLATFTNGIITPIPATNVLIFNNGASSSLVATNAATTSYVRGAVRKIGSTLFTFPIGGATGFVPLAISAPGNIADAFTAQYFRGIPIERNDITATGIDHISGCDYWELNENVDAGAANTISATFYWNANNPCNGANNYVTDPATVRAVHYTGGSWSAVSAGFGSGSNAAGSVIFAGLTTFSPFALGSTNAVTNPLPVVFANVKAYEKNNGVQIEWSNLTEKDVAEYTIERSANGSEFTAISQQLPISNQNDKANYSAFDASPIAGINYYRIKAEETTGKIVYSKVLSINLGITNNRLRLYPNPVTGNQVTVSLSNLKRGHYNLRVINTGGQDVLKQTITTQGSSLTQALELPSSVKPGVYNMVITGEGYRESKMFIVQ